MIDLRRRELSASPLVERDDQWAWLSAALAASREGQGGFAVVEGPAGVGRTELLDRLAVEAAGGGSRVLRAQGSVSESAYALGVVRQLVEEVIVKAVGHQRDQLLSGSAQAVPALLEPCGGGEPADLDFPALHGLYRLLANLAYQVPVLAIVDDAHRADRQSLRWLAYLARRVSDLPVLLVLSRTGGKIASGQTWSAIATAPGCRTVPLEPLSRVGVQRLTEWALGGEADAAFSAACYELTGGNPRLLTELLAALSRDGIPPRSDQVESVSWHGHWTLAELVHRQLRHLPADCLRLVGAVATLGAGCDLGVAGRLCGLAPAEVIDAAHALVEAGLAQFGPALTLTAGLVGESVLAELLPKERARMRSDAAALLFDAGAGAVQVAGQLLEAEPAGQEWRVTVLREAAQEALRRDPTRAGAFLCRALREPPHRPTEVTELLHLLTNTEVALPPNQLADAAVEAARAFEEWKDDGDYARAESVRAQCLFTAGHARLACDVLERAAERLREHNPDASSFLGAHRLMVGAASFAAWQVVNATPWAAEPEPEGATAGERALLAARGYLRTLRGERAEGARLATRSLERGAVTDRTTQPAGAVAASALLFGDRWVEGTKWLEAIVASSPDSEEPARDVHNQLTLAEAYQRLGDLAAAAERAEHAFDRLGHLHRRRCEELFPGRVANVYVQLGQLDRAQQVLDRFPLPDGDLGWLGCRLLISRGQVRMAQGRAGEAVVDFLEAGRRLAAWGFDSPSIGCWRSLAARAHYALGRQHEARRLAHEEMEIAQAGGDPYPIGVSLRTAGLATPGPAGLGLLRSAVAALEGTPARLELSEALIELGIAENRDDAPARARQLLRRGMILAEQSGAVPLAQRGRRELCLAGGRPRGVHLFGAAALTFMERQVTQLARQGQTNREIAEQLHVVRRTVEIHLGNAYRKLGISRRTELSGVLN